MRSLSAASALAAVLVVAGALATSGAPDVEPSPSSACEREGLVAHVIPDHARGTTFVGTYVGDSIGGVVDDHAMTTLWSVERIYAGGSLPEHLAFETPACSWVNLTPGVRYLFSTAVTGLGEEEMAPGTPSVIDSLAWELLPDGAARLAPFDTYAGSDYTSEELHVIGSFADALWSVVPDAGDGAAPRPASTTVPDCTAIDFMASPEEARGTTFLGRYVGDEVLPGPGKGDVRSLWSVDRVFAGGPLPELLSLRSNGCDAITLQAGHDYLFTTADPLAPDWGNSIAWELAEDGHVHHASFVGTDEDWYGSAAMAPSSLDEALAIVAPDTGGGEPPQRAAGRTPG